MRGCAAGARPDGPSHRLRKPVYAPPPDLARFVIARDRTCRFPTCTAQAALGDLDHRAPFPRGSTSEDNVHALCRTHHLMKTLGLWRCGFDATTGATRWTDRHGRRFTRAAATYDHAPSAELDAAAAALRDARRDSRPPAHRAAARRAQ
jgi:hypothetical protein